MTILAARSLVCRFLPTNLAEMPIPRNPFDERTSNSLRACLEIPWESCFRGEGRMARRAEGGYPQRSPTEKQRSQAAFSAKTLWAAGLLSVACVGSTVKARCGDAPVSPPWPQSKSLAAGPHAISKQALRRLRNLASDLRSMCG